MGRVAVLNPIKFLTIIILFGMIPLYSSIHSPKYKRLKPTGLVKIKKIGSLQKIDKKIEKSKNKILLVKKDIEKLEKKLNLNNENLLTLMSSKKDFYNKMSLLRSNHEEVKKKLGDDILAFRMKLSTVMVESLGEEEDAPQLLAKKILINQLNYQIKESKKKEKRAGNILTQIYALSSKVEKLKKNEMVILSLLKELENKKQKFANTYMQEIENNESLKFKYEKLKTKFILGVKNVQKGHEKYISPLDNYVNFEYQKKGLTFYFKDRGEVISPSNGSIVYSGNLSTFGNVVMIDHGNNTRSVILGNFKSKLKKGMKVRKGDLIGYTRLSKSRGKLYFEVRKKNKAQNTILLMDRKFLSKNNLNRKKKIKI